MVVLSGCSRWKWLLVVVVVVVSCPVLGWCRLWWLLGAWKPGSLEEPGSLGAWERLEGACPALSRIIKSLKEPGPQEGPGRPGKAREGPNRAKERENSLYIGVFRAFRSFRQKSKFRFGQHGL